MGAVDNALRHPQPPGREPGGGGATRGSAGSAPCPTSRMPSPSTASWRSWRLPLGRDPKDYLLELIGPPRLIDAATPMADGWLYGEDPKRYPFDTGRLRAVVEKAAAEAGWGRKLEQGAGSASPRIAASSATPPSSPRWRSTPRASSPSRGSISPSTAAPWSIPTAYARSSRALPCRASAWRPWARSPSRTVVVQTNFDGYELTRIDARADARSATHLVNTIGVRQAAGRRRRARRTAGRAGARQRDLRRLRQAHPQPADPRPARGKV